MLQLWASELLSHKCGSTGPGRANYTHTHAHIHTHQAYYVHTRYCLILYHPKPTVMLGTHRVGDLNLLVVTALR